MNEQAGMTAEAFGRCAPVITDSSRIEAARSERRIRVIAEPRGRTAPRPQYEADSGEHFDTAMGAETPEHEMGDGDDESLGDDNASQATFQSEVGVAARFRSPFVGVKRRRDTSVSFERPDNPMARLLLGSGGGTAPPTPFAATSRPEPRLLMTAHPALRPIVIPRDPDHGYVPPTEPGLAPFAFGFPPPQHRSSPSVAPVVGVGGAPPGSSPSGNSMLGAIGEGRHGILSGVSTPTTQFYADRDGYTPSPSNATFAAGYSPSRSPSGAGSGPVLSATTLNAWRLAGSEVKEGSRPASPKRKYDEIRFRPLRPSPSSPRAVAGVGGPLPPSLLARPSSFQHPVVQHEEQPSCSSPNSLGTRRGAMDVDDADSLLNGQPQHMSSSSLRGDYAARGGGGSPRPVETPFGPAVLGFSPLVTNIEARLRLSESPMLSPMSLAPAAPVPVPAMRHDSLTARPPPPHPPARLPYQLPFAFQQQPHPPQHHQRQPRAAQPQQHGSVSSPPRRFMPAGSSGSRGRAFFGSDFATPMAMADDGGDPEEIMTYVRGPRQGVFHQDGQGAQDHGMGVGRHEFDNGDEGDRDDDDRNHMGVDGAGAGALSVECEDSNGADDGSVGPNSHGYGLGVGHGHHSPLHGYASAYAYASQLTRSPVRKKRFHGHGYGQPP